MATRKSLSSGATASKTTAAKKATAKTAVKKATAKTAVKKAAPKKAVGKGAAKKVPAKKAVKKAVPKRQAPRARTSSEGRAARGPDRKTRLVEQAKSVAAQVGRSAETVAGEVVQTAGVLGQRARKGLDKVLARGKQLAQDHPMEAASLAAGALTLAAKLARKAQSRKRR